MNRHWTKRRVLLEHPDGLRRWDRAYQLLMAWSTDPAPDDQPQPSVPQQLQEEYHACQCVCASVDSTSSPKSDD
jgi:hypothetical protein